MSVTRSILLSSILGMLLMAAPAFGTGVEICDNGVGETRSGLIDCADPGCVNDPACAFVEGCCILTGCDDHIGVGGGAGFANGSVLCLENVDQATCADHVGHLDCGTASPGQECTNGHDGPICAEGQLVEGSCAFVEACPQSDGSVAAPAASAPMLAGLALLLSVGGVVYLRRRQAA